MVAEFLTRFSHALWLVLCVALASGIAACSEEIAMEDLDGFHTQIEAAFSSAQQGDDAKLMLKDYATFPWDQVYGFGGNTPLNVMRKKLGADFSLSEEAKGKLRYDATLLVFSADGQVRGQAVIYAPPYISVVEQSGVFSRDEAFLVQPSAEAGGALLAGP